MRLQFLLAVALTQVGALGVANQDQITYESSLAKAVEKSKATGKLVALVLMNDIADVESVKPLSEKKLSSLVGSFVFLKAKFEKDSGLAAKYRVESAPSLVLVNTLTDKPVKIAKLTVDEIEKALKSALPNEPKWDGNFGRIQQTVGERPALAIFIDDKDKSRSALAFLSSQLLSGLVSEFTCFKFRLDSREAKELGIQKAPVIVVFNRYSAMPIDIISLDSVHKLLKSTISEYLLWECTDKGCGRRAIEPGECCGKERGKIKRLVTYSGTEDVVLRVDKLH